MTKPKPRMGFTIDPRQHKDKSGCYYGFKTDSGFALMQGPSHMLGGSTWVNLIKVVIILVLKLDLGVNLWQGPRHELGRSTRVNVRIKFVIIIVLKLNLEINWGKT